MSTLLLTTKLFVPRARPPESLVPRAELVAHLNEGLSRKLTLISAPAGFGKTTLLAEWARYTDQAGSVPVAWVSLDAGDNDPIRFWTYIIATLQRLDSSIGVQALSLLQSPQRLHDEAVLITLINEIGNFTGSFALVLDDYHVVECPAIHQGIAYLLEHLPPHMHLVISSRADPPLMLAHLRARDDLVELRAAQLRFTPEEVAVFMNQVMGLPLSVGQIAALEKRTEGWIAGLQLTALSMRGRADLSSFVTTFTGSHRFVLDYLAEQVLEGLPAPLQDFLLKTSVLDRFNASLCDAVLSGGVTETVSGEEEERWSGGEKVMQGRGDAASVVETHPVALSPVQRYLISSAPPLPVYSAQETLEQLDQRNLFLVALDDDRRWYRYHHLFGDVLRHQLQALEPTAIRVLHRRASTWFEQHGWLPEAISHALSAGEFDRAAQLIEHAIESVSQRRELTTLAGWMQALPDAVRRAHPMLNLVYARALVDTAQFAAAENYVADAEYALDSNPPADGRAAASLWGRAMALRANLALTHGQFVPAIELSRRAQGLLPTDDATWRSFVVLNLAGAYRFTDNWTTASEAYLEASALSQAAGDNVNALIALSQRGEVLQAQGQLRTAAQQYEQILHMARAWDMPNAPVTGYALLGLGRVWCEWNDLDTAERYVREGMQRGRQAGIMDVLLRGDLALMRVRQAHTDLDGAMAALDDGQLIAQRIGVPEVHEWVKALRAQLCLACGDVQAALRWSAIHTSSDHDAVYPAIPIALARIRLHQGQPEQAIALLTHALQTAEAVGRMGNAIQILAMTALAYRAQGQPDDALAALERALTLAAPEGYIRTFVDEGTPMARLLHRVLPRTAAPNYVRQLLLALGEMPGAAPGADQQPVDSTLVERLTEREREILQLIVDGATNREIAGELVLAVNTVKKHTSNIFGKLSARNRAQAIARARELHLF